MKVKFFKAFFKKKFDDNLVKLYRTIVSHARNEGFYQLYEIPDNVNGRFDVLTLHMYIVLRRLKEIGPSGNTLAQDLFDIMLSDMDSNLREMGVGDLSVGKKVKSLAVAFYGRIKAYDDGILDQDKDTLIASLKRNLYAERSPKESNLKILEQYLRNQVYVSESWTLDDIKAGTITYDPVKSTN